MAGIAGGFSLVGRFIRLAKPLGARPVSGKLRGFSGNGSAAHHYGVSVI